MSPLPRVQVHTVLAIASLLIQACSTPGVEVTQTIRVETPGCTQVTCVLSNDRGRWEVAHTPGSVEVSTSHAPLTVTCRADAGPQRSASLPSSMGSATGAGAVVGGVVGGAAVGAAIGTVAMSMYPPAAVIAVLGSAALGAAGGKAVESDRQAIRYPGLISVPMSCGSADSAAAVASPGTALGLGIRGLTPSEAGALGLGDRGAVLVTHVVPDGRAAAIGLRAGDVVLAAGNFELGDAADLQERVRSLPPGARLELRVWRDGQVLELILLSLEAAP